MEAAVNTANSRPIVSGMAEETKTNRRLPAIRPKLRFSEALAQCKAEEDHEAAMADLAAQDSRWS